MPELTYVSWNIQDFGVARPCRGQYAAFSRFIAAVCDGLAADVLAVMELNRPTQHLNTLQNALYMRYPLGDDKWYYDWVKGAIRSGEPAGTNITQENQLGWEVRANREGYALFWKDSNKFEMLNTPNLTLSNGVSDAVSPFPPDQDIPAHCLALTLQGRTPTGRNADGFYTAPAFDGTNANGNLNFPTPNSIRLRRNGARRPSYCVIQLDLFGPANAKLVPIVFYHAPSKPNSAAAGINVSAFSRHLYQAINPATNAWVNTQKALASGDYNIAYARPPRHGRAMAYDFYTDTIAAGGAETQARIDSANTDANKTTVQLNQYIKGPPITGPNNTDYLKLPIDNIFARQLNPVAPGGVALNLLPLVRTGGGLTGNLISDFDYVLAARLATGRYAYNDPTSGTPCTSRQPRRGGGYKYGGFLVPNILHWDNFRAELQQGHFTTARHAAEFIRNFISDHLPVVYRFQW